MAADAPAILLAWEGHCEKIETYERILFASQGIKLPPRRQQKPTPQMQADAWRARARAHNAALAAAQARAKAKAQRSIAKAEQAVASGPAEAGDG